MAARTRTDVEVARDRLSIADMYLRGLSQAHIALELHISQQQVSYDLIEIRRAWTDRALGALDAARAEELAKIDRLEREYWSAWESSKKEGTETSQESTTGDKSFHKSGHRNKGRDGNPAFLAGAMKCVEMRCKLQGLDEIRETDATIRFDMLSDQDLLDRAKALGIAISVGTTESVPLLPAPHKNGTGQAGIGPWISEEGGSPV